MTADQATRADVADLLRVIARAVKGGHVRTCTVQWFGDNWVDVALAGRMDHAESLTNATTDEALAMVRAFLGEDA